MSNLFFFRFSICSISLIDFEGVIKPSNENKKDIRCQYLLIDAHHIFFIYICSLSILDHQTMYLWTCLLMERFLNLTRVLTCLTGCMMFLFSNCDQNKNRTSFLGSPFVSYCFYHTIVTSGWSWNNWYMRCLPQVGDDVFFVILWFLLNRSGYFIVFLSYSSTIIMIVSFTI